MQIKRKLQLKALKKKYAAICKDCIANAKDIVKLQEEANKNEDTLTFKELDQKWEYNIMKLTIIKEVLDDLLKL